MEKIAEKTFISDLVLEYSSCAAVQQLGKHESIMTLYKLRDGCYTIEWDIPELDDVWQIGIWANMGKKVTDYDGVFELPRQAIELLNENGFDTREVE